MKVAFRTDASLQIGIGHVMRCLTLAEMLRVGGADCRFICREHEGHLLAQIRQRGFNVCSLPLCTGDERPDHDNEEAIRFDFLGANWATDAALMKSVVGEAGVDWLIVDHYGIDARWEQASRPLCRRLMVIDDLADRLHHCDLLLDQNLGRTTSDYRELVPQECRILTGPNYALLRNEFSALRDYSLARRANVDIRHILISMGGIDLFNATGKILELLNNVPLPQDCRITVVMGSQAPWLEEVQRLAATISLPTEVSCNVVNMAQLMADSDLAIGAAGSTSWERCCLGVPSIVVVIADNQKWIAESLQAAGAAVRLFFNDESIVMQGAIARLIESSDAISGLSANAANVTDGRGSSRVAAAMNEIRGGYHS